MGSAWSIVLKARPAFDGLRRGEERLSNVGLRFTDVPVITDAFRRMVRAAEFDVCEMAATTYFCARAAGKPLVGLPVFPMRGFHHGAVWVRRGGPVREPVDFAGRSVGVNRGYTVTTGVWARGILADEYGLDGGSVNWVLSGDEHVAEFVPPPNVKPATSVRPLEEQLLDGELDGAVGIAPSHPDIVQLIPDAEQAALASVRRTGVYPINHLVVVNRDVYQRQREDVEELAALLGTLLTRHRDDTLAIDPSQSEESRALRAVTDAFGRPPEPWGLTPNTVTLEALIRHAVRQKILPEGSRLSDFFPELLDQ